MAMLVSRIAITSASVLAGHAAPRSGGGRIQPARVVSVRIAEELLRRRGEAFGSVGLSEVLVRVSVVAIQKFLRPLIPT